MWRDVTGLFGFYVGNFILGDHVANDAAFAVYREFCVLWRCLRRSETRLRRFAFFRANPGIRDFPLFPIFHPVPRCFVITHFYLSVKKCHSVGSRRGIDSTSRFEIRDSRARFAATSWSYWYLNRINRYSLYFYNYLLHRSVRLKITNLSRYRIITCDR